MRIKSDFKDYYDGLLANDEDRESLYLRRHEEIEHVDIGRAQYFPALPLDTGMCGLKHKHKSFTIGFCGKLYGMVKLEATIRHQKVSCIAYSLEDVDWFIKQNFSTSQFEGYTKKKYYYWDKNCNWCNCHARSAFFTYFESIEKWKDSCKEVFEKYRAPALVFEEVEKFHPTLPFRRYHLVVNPKLAAYGFQKIFPPYQAYQEVRMWLSNLTSPERPIPHISNKDMIEAKGFDLKSSFRKEKKK